MPETPTRLIAHGCRYVVATALLTLTSLHEAQVLTTRIIYPSKKAAALLAGPDFTNMSVKSRSLISKNSRYYTYIIACKEDVECK